MAVYGENSLYYPCLTYDISSTRYSAWHESKITLQWFLVNCFFKFKIDLRMCRWGIQTFNSICCHNFHCKILDNKTKGVIDTYLCSKCLLKLAERISCDCFSGKDFIKTKTLDMRQSPGTTVLKSVLLKQCHEYVSSWCQRIHIVILHVAQISSPAITVVYMLKSTFMRFTTEIFTKIKRNWKVNWKYVQNGNNHTKWK